MKNKLEEYKKVASMIPGSAIMFQLEPDDSMKVLFYSKNAQKLTGMNQVEVDQTVSHNGFDMILEDDQKVIIEKVKTALEKQSELDVIYRQHHKSYGVVWVHMKAAIIGELDGLAVFLATMLDVTHEMLNSSGIMEASDRAICVIEKNSKLLLYGNSNFYDMIDGKPSESMGVHCYEALCGNPAFRTDNKCLCFSTINIDKPFEYYNPESKRYLSMYGRELLWGEHEAYVFYLSDQTEEKFREKQLKNAQERFEMTLDNSDLYIWEYDMVNNQCLNPQKAVREYGLPPVIDNYPESLYDLGHTPPETVEQIKEVKRRLLNGETGFSVERRTIDGNGNSQWMKVNYTLEKDLNGRPLRALVCGTDITAQKKKELAYEEELRLKKNVTSDTKILALLNLTQNRVMENDSDDPRLADYLKLGTVDEVIDAVCSGLVVDSDQTRYREHFCRTRMLENVSRGVTHDAVRHQFQHLPGWFESAYDLIQNPTTGDIEAITSMKDVTDEERLKQVVTKLTTIDYDMIMTIDTESGEGYRFEQSADGGENPGQRMETRQYEAYCESFIRQYCTEREAERIREHISMAYVVEKLKSMPMYTFMYTLNKPDGIARKRYVYMYLDQSHKMILCASQDVTDAYLLEEKQKKELAEALSRAEIANQAKTSFLSRVSHDMRTPLNGVLGLTTLMKDEIVEPEALKDLKQLELSGKYLLDLINDVLDVSSIESGKMELHPSVCDGKLVLQNILKLIKPSMDAKKIEFVLESDDMILSKVFIDEARLQQVALNILGNAAKFTQEGGKVEFRSKTVSTEHGIITNEFVIRDNGIGMDPAFIPRLFEPFSQENASITNSKNGTGLGMSITKKIVELMNGTIRVESSKGEGTTVTVTFQFPVATEAQIIQSKAAVAPHVTSYHLEGKRVLLCEDHPLNFQIAKRLLEKVGVSVDHADNGKSGVVMFENAPLNHYDAILMDIRMPVMDGLEAARTIRACKRSDAARIPILAMTANALDEDVRNTVAAGMNAHLAKPINPLQLYQNLDKYVNSESAVNRPKILVVDDMEVNRAVLASALVKYYDILEAENGEQALALLKSRRGIDLIVTDILMPVMDGVSLIKKVRADEAFRRTAIIAYTQHEQSDQEEMLLELGVDDFIYKPSSPKVIELRVKNVIARG